MKMNLRCTSITAIATPKTMQISELKIFSVLRLTPGTEEHTPSHRYCQWAIKHIIWS